MAAAVLVRQGFEVACVDPAPDQPSPQSAHVHHVAPETWAKACLFLPKLKACLDARDGLPDRADLDRRLAATLPEGIALHRAAYRTARRTGDCWQIDLDTGVRLGASVLIDATGRHRRTLRALSKTRGQALLLDEGPASGSYRSCRIDAGAWLPGQRTFRFSAADGNTGVLGQRCEHGQWRLTLVSHGPDSTSPWERLLELLPDHLRQSLVRAGAPRRWDRYGAQKAGLLALDQVSDNAGWLPLGDALLTTAPYQGEGIANAVRQVEALDRSARAGGQIRDWQAAVFSTARRDWFRAMFGDLLRQAPAKHRPTANPVLGA